MLQEKKNIYWLLLCTCEDLLSLVLVIFPYFLTFYSLNN